MRTAWLQQRGWRLEEKQRLSWHFIAEFLGVVAIVSAYADDLRWRDRSEQVGCAERTWLEAETDGIGARVVPAKFVVIVGSADEIDDPGLGLRGGSGAIFDGAVVGLSIEQEAAIFHGR